MGVRCWMMGVRCWIIALLLLVPGTTILISCQEGGEAGDLFGQWRLTETKYISFSGSIVSFRGINNFRSHEVFGKFQHVGDSLFIQCSSIRQQKADTTVVEDKFGMKPFTNIRVRIDAMDSDRILLSKDGQRWTLEKY